MGGCKTGQWSLGSGRCVDLNSWGVGKCVFTIVGVPLTLFILKKIVNNSHKKGRLVLLDINQKFWHGSSSPPCCPSGSHPALSTSYHEQGEEIQLKDPNKNEGDDDESTRSVNAYVVGRSNGSKRCIIVFHDIFGWHSGRTREICDTLASTGYLVILPDCFQGRAGRMSTMWIGIFRYLSMVTNIRNSPWDRLRIDLETMVWPFLQDQGIDSVGCLGFCYGGWCVAKATSSVENGGFGISNEEILKMESSSNRSIQKDKLSLRIKCGIGLHASPGVVGWFHGEGSASSLYQSCQTPLMFLQAGNDPNECKVNGPVHQELIRKKSTMIQSVVNECVFKEFKDMSHGWTNRGDLSDPLVERDYIEAFKLCTGFFTKHL